MANASKDDNRVPTLIAGLETDGVTIVRITADPTNHGLSVNDASTGTDYGPENAPIDENHIPALMAVSSDDGTTPVVVYATSSGELLIDSN